jgi:hypothetical protein
VGTLRGSMVRCCCPILLYYEMSQAIVARMLGGVRGVAPRLSVAVRSINTGRKPLGEAAAASVSREGVHSEPCLPPFGGPERKSSLCGGVVGRGCASRTAGTCARSVHPHSNSRQAASPRCSEFDAERQIPCSAVAGCGNISAVPRASQRSAVTTAAYGEGQHACRNVSS